MKHEYGDYKNKYKIQPQYQIQEEMGVIQSVKESFARAPQGRADTTNGMLDEDLPTNTNTQ